MVIVDSTVWVDYFNGKSNQETRLLESRIGREDIGLIDLILCEVLQGLHSERELEEVKTLLLEYSIFPTGGLEMALQAATNYRKLRARGFTIRKLVKPRRAIYDNSSRLAEPFPDRRSGKLNIPATGF